MSFAALAGEARESARLERILVRLRKEHQAQSPTTPERGWRIAKFLDPVYYAIGFIVFHIGWILALLPGALAIIFIPEGYFWQFFGLLMLLLSGYWRGRRLISIKDFDALMMPSREGLLAARWIGQLPFFLWMGFGWALFLSARIKSYGGAIGFPTLPLLLTFALVPLGRALAGGLGLIWNTGWRSQKFGWMEWSCFNFIRSFLPLVFLLFVGFHTGVAKHLLLEWTPIVGPIMLIPTVFALLNVSRQWFFPRPAKGGVRPPMPLAGEGAKAKPEKWSDLPLLRPRWRGLFGAEVERALASFYWDLVCREGRSRRPLNFIRRALGATINSPFLFFILYSWGPVLAIGAVLTSGNPQLAVGLSMLGGLIAWNSISVGLRDDETIVLYFFGVDLRQILLHSLKALGLVAAAPAVLAGLLTALFSGADTMKFAIVMVMGTTFIYRAWLGIPFACGGLLKIFLTAIGIVLGFGIWGAPSPEWLAMIAGAAALIGLAGLLRRIRLLDEPRLLADLRRAEES